MEIHLVSSRPLSAVTSGLTGDSLPHRSVRICVVGQKVGQEVKYGSQGQERDRRLGNQLKENPVCMIQLSKGSLHRDLRTVSRESAGRMRHHQGRETPSNPDAPETPLCGRPCEVPKTQKCGVDVETCAGENNSVC